MFNALICFQAAWAYSTLPGICRCQQVQETKEAIPQGNTMDLSLHTLAQDAGLLKSADPLF